MSAKALAGACNSIGADENLVQGGGGNISLKQGNLMLIKASGVKLSEVSPTKGIARVEYARIKEFVVRASQKGASEAEYLAALSESARAVKERPSMETGFHAILGKAIVHTHPVAVNSLACAENAEELLNEAYPKGKFAFTPYETPGIKLSALIHRRFAGNGTLFLENHGLIVSSSSLEEAVQKTFTIAEQASGFMARKKNVRVHLPSKVKTESNGRGKFIVSGIHGAVAKHFENGFPGFLFPDAAVYLPNGFTAKETGGNRLEVEIDSPYGQNALDAAIVSLCVLVNLSQFSKPKYLGAKKARELVSMEAERFRRNKA